MPEMRLYVGGLSDKVDRAALELRLSHYVSVFDVNLKEKTDADGNVLFKFAHASIDAPTSQIEECMRQLNGASWHGSFLRVEPAKESFLDRLKRERATMQQHEKKQPSHDEKGGEIIIQKPPKDLEAERSDAVNKNQTNMKKKDKTSNESAHVEISLCKDAMHTSECQKEKRKKLKRKDSEKTCLTAENKLPVLLRSSSQKKNKVEEEMLSSFKSFSSVWADSDSENNEILDVKRNDLFDDKKDISDPDEYNDIKSAKSSYVKSLRPCKEVKSVEQAEENVVCEPDAENKYVKITKALNFGQKSSGFSLLAQFSQQRKAGDEESGTKEVTVPVSALSRPVVLQHRQVKKKNFFVLPSDPRIEAAITWMAQSLTEEISKEFTEAQPHLREFYKTQAVLAQRKKQYGRGRGRGIGSRNPNEQYKW
ncbi:uncharacterized protein [Panulirus ornatus]